MVRTLVCDHTYEISTIYKRWNVLSIQIPYNNTSNSISDSRHKGVMVRLWEVCVTGNSYLTFKSSYNIFLQYKKENRCPTRKRNVLCLQCSCSRTWSRLIIMLIERENRHIGFVEKWGINIDGWIKNVCLLSCNPIRSSHKS